MTRLWPVGLPIEVQVDSAGCPLFLVWQGRTHTVEGVAKQWRVDLGWWQVRLWRDYFKLTTDTGLLVVIYQDLVRGTWRLQQLYD